MIELLIAFGGPCLQLALALVPLFYQWKIIKTEEDRAELERRIKAAIVETEQKAKAPLDIRGQYDRAKQAAKDKLDKLI